jgi:hypothetical protein
VRIASIRHFTTFYLKGLVNSTRILTGNTLRIELYFENVVSDLLWGGGGIIGVGITWKKSSLIPLPIPQTAYSNFAYMTSSCTIKACDAAARVCRAQYVCQ